jgi:hypothetical protein
MFKVNKVILGYVCTYILYMCIFTYTLIEVFCHSVRKLTNTIL